MFNSKIKLNEDLILPNSEPHQIVKTHLVEFTVTDWCQSLFPALKFVLLTLRPVKRIKVNIENVHTDDEKLIIEMIEKNLEKLHVDSKCNAKKVTFSGKNLINNRIILSKKYSVFNTKDIKFDGKPNTFTNHVNFINIGANSSLSFEGTVEENNALIAGTTYHGMFPTPLRNITYTQNEKDGLERINGTFTIRYTDNISGPELLNWGFNYIIDLVKDILSNIDEYLEDNNGLYSLRISNDRSNVISNLLDMYIHMEYIKFSNGYTLKITKNEIDFDTNMSFEEKDITKNELKKIIVLSFGNLIDDLKNLLIKQKD